MRDSWEELVATKNFKCSCRDFFLGTIGRPALEGIFGRAPAAGGISFLFSPSWFSCTEKGFMEIIIRYHHVNSEFEDGKSTT